MKFEYESKIQSLEILDLVVFYFLYERGSASKVAKDLGLSSSKVSRSISSLREAFHEELFIRTRYGFQPTSLSNKLAPCVSDTLENVMKIQEELKSDDRGSHSITACVPPSVIRRMSINVANCNSFGDNIKNVRLLVSDSESKTRLRTGQIDILIDFEDSSSPDTSSSMVTLKERTYFVANSNSRCWKVRQTMLLGDIESQQYQMFTLDKGSVQEKKLEDCLLSGGLPKHMICTTSNIEELLSQLLMKEGFSILTESEICTLSTCDAISYETIENTCLSFLSRVSGCVDIYVHEKRQSSQPDASPMKRAFINELNNLCRDDGISI